MVIGRLKTTTGKEKYRATAGDDLMATNQIRRKTIRLKDYDYSQAGYYFVTICTQNRKNILGQIVTAGADSISAPYEIILNSAGRMVKNIYCDMENEFENIILHEYVIMPNHLHGIIQIKQADLESGLPKIIQSFKRHKTVEYARGVKNNIYPPFIKHIWQRGYYDHIIRNENELQEIRQYILDNPAKWWEDEYFN